jgi:hypothetical protein
MLVSKASFSLLKLNIKNEEDNFHVVRYCSSSGWQNFSHGP